MDFGVGDWRKRIIIEKWRLPKDKIPLSIDELMKLYPLSASKE
jgi:hypothetical protein